MDNDASRLTRNQRGWAAAEDWKCLDVIFLRPQRSPPGFLPSSRAIG